MTKLPPRGQPGNAGQFRASHTAGGDPSRYTNLSFPTRYIREVAHIGTLNATDKTEGSYEGAGLSVSVAPGDWAHIARLPGPVWTLTRHDGRPFCFVEAHDMDPQIARDHAVRNGYASAVEAWTVPCFDEDGEPSGQTTFLDREDAAYEAEEYDTEPVPVDALVVTAEMAERTGGPPGSVAYPEHLVVLWAEDTTDADGVWWADRHDPLNLSAPRGTVFARTMFEASPGWSGNS